FAGAKEPRACAGRGRRRVGGVVDRGGRGGSCGVVPRADRAGRGGTRRDWRAGLGAGLRRARGSTWCSARAWARSLGKLRAGLMFTGIVTALGEVTAVERQSGLTRLTIASPYDAASIEIGASIAHDGCCLTVVEKSARADGASYVVEAAAETLRLTTMSMLRE